MRRLGILIATALLLGGAIEAVAQDRHPPNKAVPNASLEEAQAWSRTEAAYWRKVTNEVKVELPD